MPILDTEIKLYKSKTVGDSAANGGRMGSAEVISGAVQNLFPHVSRSEREAGLVTLRKVFFKVANDSDLTLIGPMIWLDAPTPGDDWVVFHAGTQTDTQGDLTGSERLYGCAALASNAAAGDSTLVVDVEDATLTSVFQDGDTIRITDKASPADTAGNEEFHTISGAPSVSGTQVTISIAGTLANTYTTADSGRVSTVYEPGDTACGLTGWTETSAAGTYDEAGYPVQLDNIGTVEQQVTLTFTDATHFTATSDDPDISLPSGDIATDYAPQNPDFSKPFFTLQAAGWGGTWAPGDTVVFTTHPAAVPVWEKRVVPAGCNSVAGDQAVIVCEGESA